MVKPCRKASTMTDPEQLKAEIAQTRSDLAATVDELSHRVDPREQAKSAAGAGSEAGANSPWATRDRWSAGQHSRPSSGHRSAKEVP